MLNDTHDPQRRSWVETASSDDTDFPIQNLPFGMFRVDGGTARGGVAIGDQIVDLAALATSGLCEGDAARAAQAAGGDSLASLLALGRAPSTALRARLSRLLSTDVDAGDRATLSAMLIPQTQAEMLLPMRVREFSAFALSAHHVGRRHGVDDDGHPRVPDTFRWLPNGYNGRPGTVFVSGTPIRRPWGQWRALPDSPAPTFAPEPKLDFEAEIGLWVAGPATAPGTPLSLAQARARLFGHCLLNDWSARAMQGWDSLHGPFTGKTMATSVSPWIVTTDALEPFRIAAPAGPRLLPYLDDAEDQREGAYDISVDVWIRSEAMRRDGVPPWRLCRSSTRHIYWTWAQILATVGSNGAPVGEGDLIGSGIVSGPAADQVACLSERRFIGEWPWTLPGGEHRAYLADGDEITLNARAERDGYVSIGFGGCTGRVMPAPDWPAA